MVNWAIPSKHTIFKILKFKKNINIKVLKLKLSQKVY